MKNISVVMFLILLLAGCATQETKVAEINLAMGGNHFGVTFPTNLAKLKTFQSNPYLTSSVTVDPDYISEYSSAMESAVFNRSIEAVKYLVEINAPSKVSLRWSDPLTGKWKRTPVNVPVAEMACAMGEIDMMMYLQEKYPQDSVNYTNCLNFYVSSGLKTDPKSLRHGHAGSVVKTIIELGADVNGSPEYGKSLHYGVLDLEAYTELQEALLLGGLNPDARYPCPMGECSHLTTVSAYENAKHATDMMYLLLVHGADINISVRNRIEVDVLTTGELKYETRDVTPLHTAAYFGRPELYARLIDLGADETIVDNLGNKPQEYAGVYHEFKKLSEEQKRRHQEMLAQQRQRSNANDDFFGKALAIGFGAAAIGSMDVSPEIAGKAFSALASDIMTDSGGTNLNQLNQEAMRELKQSQRSFNNDVGKFSAKNSTTINQGQNGESDNTSPKRLDCSYEYIKAKQRATRELGHISCNESRPGGRDDCLRIRERARMGEANRFLAVSGLSQCQISLPPPIKRVKPETPKEGSQKEA